MTLFFRIVVLSAGLTAVSTEARDIHFTSGTSYCSPAASYLQALVTLSNPSNVVLTGTVTLSLRYQTGAGTYKVDTAVGGFNLAANANPTFLAVVSSVNAYGCHGGATVKGKIHVDQPGGFLVADGRWLSNQMEVDTSFSMNQSLYASVPFSINSGKAF